MAVKTYGTIRYDHGSDSWLMTAVQPHVRIKLKAIFSKIKETAEPPYKFPNTTENATDLDWFISRYPLDISDTDRRRLTKRHKLHISQINQMETILLPDHIPASLELKEPYKARNYQLSAREVLAVKKRMLLGDEMGLGKTLTAILGMSLPGALPVLVVVKPHLAEQWERLGINKFTYFIEHRIKVTTPYNLPPADVYIISYSCLSGWSDLLSTGFFKYVIFDEVHELRTGTSSNKGQAASIVSKNAEYVYGLGATPIYNYGSEIWCIMDIINPGCLGTYTQFAREWCGYGSIVADPEALGTYLRENFLMLRRTREDVKMEVPVVNQIVQYVDYDEKLVDDSIELAKALAMRVFTGTFEERGQAAREFDMKLRQLTGVAKAKQVAAYARFILEAGEPLIIAAWHREVWDILLSELKDYRPLMYTGSESPLKKQRNAEAFMNGESPLLFMSLRSADGVDGLQNRCNHLLVAELDWSPKVHDQLAGRLDRPGQEQQVTKHFVVTDWGSDPPIIDMLALKSSQSHGIVDPGKEIVETHTDEGRIKKMAEAFLGTQKPDLLKTG